MLWENRLSFHNLLSISGGKKVENYWETLLGLVSSEHSSFSHRYFCTPASRIFSSNFLEGFLIVIVLELLIMKLFIIGGKDTKKI